MWRVGTYNWLKIRGIYTWTEWAQVYKLPLRWCRRIQGIRSHHSSTCSKDIRSRRCMGCRGWSSRDMSRMGNGQPRSTSVPAAAANAGSPVGKVMVQVQVRAQVRAPVQPRPTLIRPSRSASVVINVQRLAAWSLDEKWSIKFQCVIEQFDAIVSEAHIYLVVPMHNVKAIDLRGVGQTPCPWYYRSTFLSRCR